MSRDPMVARTRSPYAYVEGNPLNGTDPSGLYEYTTSWSLGNYGPNAAIRAMHIIQQHANTVFPFWVEGDNNNDHLVVGGEYKLHTNVLPFHTDPVVVSDLTDTSFTFTTGWDHIEGGGATITFSTCVDSSGNLILSQHAVGPDFFGNLGGFNFLNDLRLKKAQELWLMQAQSLQYQLDLPPGSY